MTTYIYALIDPRNSETRWVGQTNNPARRLGLHLATPDKNQAKWSWITELKGQGQKPTMQILEEVEDNAANTRERWWIRELGQQGANLLNIQIHLSMPYPEPSDDSAPHNTKARSEQLRDVALRLMTPDLQRRLENGDKQARRDFIKCMMSETECPWESARNWAVKALEIRQGKRTETDKRGGFNPANAGDNHWKRNK